MGILPPIHMPFIWDMRLCLRGLETCIYSYLCRVTNLSSVQLSTLQSLQTRLPNLLMIECFSLSSVQFMTCIELYDMYNDSVEVAVRRPRRAERQTRVPQLMVPAQGLISSWTCCFLASHRCRSFTRGAKLG